MTGMSFKLCAAWDSTGGMQHGGRTCNRKTTARGTTALEDLHGFKGATSRASILGGSTVSTQQGCYDFVQTYLAGEAPLVTP